MEPRRALRIAAYVLVADGLAALYLGRLLGLVGMAVAIVVAVGAWWQEPLRARLARIPGAGPAVVVAAALALALDVTWTTTEMLDVFTHLLVGVLLARLYTLRSMREARDVAFLAFFMLVAAAPVVLSVAFLGLFLVLVLGGTWMLMLRHLLAEGEITSTVPPPGTLGLGRGLTRLGGAAVVITVAIAGMLFLVVPRLGQAALPLSVRTTRLVAGFSERVALGAFGEIEADSTVVMRVELPGWRDEQGSPDRLPLRWRGMAFDHFDGREWRAGEPQRFTLQRRASVPFPVNRFRGRPALTQEVFLEPLGSEAIFGAPRVVRFAGRTDVITLDDLGNVLVHAPSARLRYTVDSELETPDPRLERLPDGRTPDSPAWRARFTQLPPLPPRIVELAREIAAGAADPYEAALRLNAHLAERYRYTRVLERTTDLDPIEEFLFVRHAGNCEYFAASLAVMLRSLGIPARVVNGFQRGEWNPYGRYFMVRLRDAHSWVEVFVDGSGWVTLDPSPRGDTDAAAAPLPATLWLDALRMRWYRYVVNWSLHDQLSAALAVRRTATAWTAWPPWRPAWLGDVRTVLGVGAGVLALATAATWLRRRSGAAVAAAVPSFYARALRTLARRGLVPATAETAREFSARVAMSAPACSVALARLTAGYERMRFGATAMSAAEIAALAADAATLEATHR